MQHSKTVMGSGAFPSADYPVAAHHMNIFFADAVGTIFHPAPALLKDEEHVYDALCYDLAVRQGNFTDSGIFFFFRCIWWILPWSFLRIMKSP
jgi:hypothetical protein